MGANDAAKAMKLADWGARALALVQERSPGAQAEAFLLETESASQEWSEGIPENLSRAKGHGLGLRVIREGRLGFAHTNRLETRAVEAAADRALAAARFTAQDPLQDISAFGTAVSAADLQLVDDSLTSESMDSRAAFLSSVEADVKRRDTRLTKVLRASYREGRMKAVVMNSRGVSASYEGTSASVAVACVAVEGTETQVGYGFQATRHFADLKPGWVIDKSVEQTLALLGGKQLPSGVYDLILDPWVSAEILQLFAHALRADMVQKGKSFLATKVGERVGAACVNLVDDGRLPKGLGSSPFDAEGWPTQTTTLLEEGVLQGFLYDGYTARKAGRRSTGNAGRGSYKGVPEPEETNFYLKPGPQSPEQMIAGIKSGLYVRNVMGLHTVDTISGDYSLGVMGQRIDNGVLTHGVRGVTIAGNLLDLLKNVEAVGSDLVFSGSVGSPTLRVGGVSVGGA